MSLDDLATALFYHAFKIGKNIQWQEDSVSDFVKRAKKYDRVLLKVEDATNKNGAKKLSSIKKYIREGVESRYKSIVRACDNKDVGENQNDRSPHLSSQHRGHHYMWRPILLQLLYGCVYN